MSSQKYKSTNKCEKEREERRGDKKGRNKRQSRAGPLILATGRQMNLCTLKTSLIYIVSSKPAKATQ